MKKHKSWRKILKAMGYKKKISSNKGMITYKKTTVKKGVVNGGFSTAYAWRNRQGKMIYRNNESMQKALKVLKAKEKSL